MIVDAVAFTSTTSGVGNLAETGAVAGFRLLSAAGIPTGTVVGYRIDGGSDWEVGEAAVNAGSPWTISRAPRFSSAGGAAVNWPSGPTRTVWLSASADALRFGGIGQLPTAGGTANALTVAHAAPLVSRQRGRVVRFLAGSAANTGAATLAVDATGAADLRDARGQALLAGALQPGALCEAVWTGAAWWLAGAAIDAAWFDIGAATVVSGATAAVDFTIPAWARAVRLEVEGMRTDLAGGRSVGVRLDIGVGFRAGVADYVTGARVPQSASADTLSHSQTRDFMPIFDLARSDLDTGGHVTVRGLQSTGPAQLRAQMDGTRGGLVFGPQDWNGVTAFSGVVTALRVLAPGGTINAGRFKLTGARLA